MEDHKSKNGDCIGMHDPIEFACSACEIAEQYKMGMNSSRGEKPILVSKKASSPKSVGNFELI